VTVYYPQDELRAIPKEIWAKLPKYKSSRLDGLRKIPFPVEYDSSVNRAYKSKESFEYIKGILHKISPMLMESTDELIFRKSYSYGSDFSITVKSYANGGWSHDCVFGKGSRQQRTASRWEVDHQEKEFGKLWDTLRAEAVEKILSPKKQAKRDVRNTAALIKLGAQVTKLSNEVESFRTKILDESITQKDISNMYFTYMEFNAECKSLKKNLPK